MFAPTRGMLIAAGALVFIDLITGVWASYKQGHAIQSSGLQRTIVKLVVYESAILLAFLAQTYLIPDLPVTNIVSSFVGLTELKSCYENIDIISGENLLKRIIDRLSSANHIE